MLSGLYFRTHADKVRYIQQAMGERKINGTFVAKQRDAHRLGWKEESVLISVNNIIYDSAIQSSLLIPRSILKQFNFQKQKGSKEKENSNAHGFLGGGDEAS